MWYFLNLELILLNTFIAWEMDTFFILSEQALKHQWNFDFVHSNKACILLHKGGTRPGRRPHCKGWQWPACPEVVDPERTIGVGWIWWLQYPSRLTVTEIHSMFSLSRGPLCHKGQLLPVWSSPWWGDSQHWTVLFPPSCISYLASIWTIKSDILWKWREY